MKNIMKKQLLLIALPIAIVFSSCQNNSNKETADNSSVETEELSMGDDSAGQVDMHTSEISLDWEGTYEGTLPCADCPGIKTTLTINEDHTYVMEQEYLDRDSKHSEKGSFDWNENGSDITITSEDGNKQIFKVGEGRIFFLDQEGKMIEGELADNYVLIKK